ncbi:MAG: phenylalanine--tRNA ligase subunit alpha [Candidatus Eremiobacteraeota bacterium]|nr:phenylalanine--tRNA ligase subunit alpha [Candidatus Eremiobacteraeota bacterium]
MNNGGMENEISDLEDDVARRAAVSRTPAELEAIRTEVFGRRGGRLSRIMATLPTMPPAQRAQVGLQANQAKKRIEEALAAAQERLTDAEMAVSLGHKYDVSFPGTAPRIQPIHVLRRTLNDVAEFFRHRGFAIVMGPEIENEYYNFEAMNIPPDHPARDSMDTFYLPDGNLLRTHTSPMQVRAMLRYPSPLAILVPGRVYRRDALDASHSFTFHQIEGLQVDRGVTFGHLKAFARDLCRHLFGPGRRTRFRPSYFQFTEPSAEVDVSCGLCDGAGCRTCGGSGWLEMGGSGMVHPKVLREAGYDPENLSGWAWGLGIERMAMLRHGIDDIRVFSENEPAALDQIA